MITDDTYRLLRACRDFQDEDTPRLALADEMQASGFDLAGQYVRSSISRATSVRRKKSLPRTIIGGGYIRWLEALFGLPDSRNSGVGICAGEGWDSFHWRVSPGDHRRWCELQIERGLPKTIRVTAPLFMERAPQLFLFPLTGCKLTDRKPERDDFANQTTWHWGSTSIWPETWNTWEDRPHTLPGDVFCLLPKETNRSRGTHSTKAIACSALELAATNYGRAQVA